MQSTTDGLEQTNVQESPVKQATLFKRSVDVKQHYKKEGVLTAEVVSSHLTNLGRYGTGLQYVYDSLSLPRHNLRDVSILCNYVYLQKLELTYNKIKDLSCVSHMTLLTILDASHNEVCDFFGFQPPKNLKEVNFSHNCMTKMKDLSAHTSLCKLELDYNSFTEVSGLEQCCRLTHLSLAHNKISSVSSLDNLPLVKLCLRGNQLKKIEGLEGLKCLQFLDLSLNRITSLSGLQNLPLLGSINLENNLISEIQEAKHIHDLSLLRDLNLQGNPVQEQPDYRQSIIFLLQHLTRLDQEKVTTEDKVAAVNKYDPPMDVVAAMDYLSHLVYHLMQPQVLYESTLPNADSPYPMLVLTGPQGCGKRELAHRFCQEFSEYFGYGTCHTTREPYFGEEDETDYHFVSEEDFQNMIQMGKFVQTMQYGGHSYGLTRDAIEGVAREGLACCVHMELEGVMSLKNSYFEPRYILLIPMQVEEYMGHLRSRGLYTQDQMDTAVARLELYKSTNRHQPGFFDDVITCDDFEEAYQSLSQVVKGYLLLEDQGEGDLDNKASSDLNNAEEKPDTALSQSESGAKSLSGTTLDPSDPSYRNYLNKIQTELSPQKSPAELASIRRREQLVREAIVGKSPGAYSQLFKSSAQTATSSLLSQNQEPQTDVYEDSSSSDGSGASSVLSVPSSAGACSALVEPPDSSVQGHTLEPLKGQTPDPALPPGTEQLKTTKSPSSERPGSNMKPILSPIPTGRKTPAPQGPKSTA
ncbi:leucine-rich repeat and guanylate kinase domain-containing protein [Genypterus blacodes]|uniref:leucine-rich repeat and guanylate kinase domain-containing protein n=1 Tax=Genypterus blacodes TaxID=154954 RepID=UPI003F7600DE